MQNILGNLRATSRSGGYRRNPLIILGFLAVFAFAAHELAGYVINNDMTGLAYVGLTVVVGTCVVAMLNNWRNGLYLFLIWLMFEDLARKYLGNNMAIYFGKDFLVTVVYIAFFIALRKRQAETFKPPFRMPLLMLLWFAIMQMFNPASTPTSGLCSACYIGCPH